VRFKNELILHGGCFVEITSPESCCVWLESCVPSCPGEEISVPVASANAEWLRHLLPGQFVWVLFRGATPLGLADPEFFQETGVEELNRVRFILDREQANK
jgi:hypothetical protein